MKKQVLITGSAGLVGSEAVKFFISNGFAVHGIDNNMRKVFFGGAGSTIQNQISLMKNYPAYKHHDFDIRSAGNIQKLFKTHRFDLIIHTAAQPSHDWAARDPLTDFSINATATLALLEEYRKHSPHAVFIFTSTNKVYGDRPNSLPLVEHATRYELPKKHPLYKGINESMNIDNTLHSVFGSSKVAADIMVQEYGKYFGLATVSFRCGCITGPAHAGVPLHGFLAYLVRCIAGGTPYTIYGYKGKQVRDNIHAYDLVNAFYHFYKNPKNGEIYNMGGSRYSNTSILEAIKEIEKLLRKKAKVKLVKTPRLGDHMWYISDVSKFKKDYPKWKYSYDNHRILEELCRARPLTPERSDGERAHAIVR